MILPTHVSAKASLSLFAVLLIVVASAVASQESTIPVVFVHGYCTTPIEAFGPFGSGTTLPELLEADGYTVFLANLSEAKCQDARCVQQDSCVGCDDKPIEALAVRLGQAIQTIRREYGASQVDVVAHSMGGLVARAYIAGLARDGNLIFPYREDIRRLVMAGTPNYGAVGAKLNGLRNLAPAVQCSETQARQLRTGSAFIWELHTQWQAVPNHPSTLVISGITGYLDPTGSCRVNLDPVDDDDDGVVNIYSAALNTTSSDRVRYVPYKHSLAVPCPSNSPSLLHIGGGVGPMGHTTFRLVRSFLKNGQSPPREPGEVALSKMALERGMVVLRLINGNATPVELLPLYVNVEFTPPVVKVDSSDHNTDSKSGSISLIGAHPSASYDVKVLVSATAIGVPLASHILPWVPITGTRATLQVVTVFGGRAFTAIEAPGAWSTSVRGINDAGQIVGDYYDGTTSRGFLLSNGTFTSIDFPGASSTSAHGLNNAGQIVGSYSDGNTSHGFLLTHGTFTPITFPGASWTSADGINNSGQIVGSYSDDDISRGFLLGNGTFTSIRFPGAAETSSYGINDAGQIVGAYGDGFDSVYGFLLRNGTFTAIKFPGASGTGAAGINNAGQIVGEYSRGGDEPVHGFALMNGRFTSIDNPRAAGSTAYGIDNAGRIIGSYYDEGFVAHGFITFSNN